MAECKDLVEIFAKRDKCEEHVLSGIMKNSPPCSDVIHVFSRLKPIESNQTSCIVDVVVQKDKTSRISQPAQDGSQKDFFEYSFNKVFNAGSTQEEVYTRLSFPLLEDIVDGFNAVLFVYGVKGSGKTHTMIGTPVDPGLLPRCVDTIFNTIANYQARKSYFVPDKANGYQVFDNKGSYELQLLDKKNKVRNLSEKEKETRDRKEKRHFLNFGVQIVGADDSNLFAIFITYVTIYKNNYYDLLGDKIIPEPKTLKEDSNHNFYVSNITEIEVRSATEVNDLYSSAKTRILIHQAALGKDFNKGHSIFNIRLVQGKRIRNPGDNPVVSQLSIVDLYPWEKNCPVQHRKDTQAELDHLQRCLQTLRDNCVKNQLVDIPCDRYKLTALFEHCFKGLTHINMIVCINPEQSNYDEVRRTLMFATNQYMLADEKLSEENEANPRKREESLVKSSFSNVIASTAFARHMVSALDQMKIKGTYDAEYAFLKRRLKERMIATRHENIWKMYRKKEGRLLKKAQSMFEFDQLADNIYDYLYSNDSRLEVDCRNRSMIRQIEILDQDINDNISRQADQVDIVRRMWERQTDAIRSHVCNDDLPTVQGKIQRILDGLKLTEKKE